MLENVPRLAAAAAIFFMGATVVASAQDITLTSRDGSVELSGTLLQYDGEFFRLRTMYGDMTVAGDGVVCNGPGCPDPAEHVARIALSGSRAITTRMIPPLIETYARQRNLLATKVMQDDAHFSYRLARPDGSPVAEIALRASTTVEGIADLIAVEADIALGRRNATAREFALAAEAGIGNLGSEARSHIIGLDALVAVVAQDNPVTKLSLAELAGVFSGDIANWKDLGGPDAPITAYAREAGAASDSYFATHVLAPQNASMAVEVRRLSSDAALSDAVVADPFGIALTSFSEIANARPLALAGRCGFAVAATSESLKSGDYPLTIRLRMFTPARRLPRLARSFLRFLHTEAAQAVLPHAGFVGQDIVEVPLVHDGTRLAYAIAAAGDGTGLADLQRMVETLDGAHRLSAGFRFRDGSTRMDARSQLNLQFLAERIATGAFDLRELILVGYSDAVGAAGANRRLSLDRAAAVRAALLEAVGRGGADQVKLTVAGLGEVSPLACDDSDWGRRVNRRVEVWVRDQR